MENKSNAVLTDDDVVFLEDIDYIEIDQDEKALNEVITKVVRKKIEVDFNNPDFMKNATVVAAIEKEVKRKLNYKSYNIMFEKNRDMFIEIASEITHSILKQRYHLQPDEKYKTNKLREINGDFSSKSLRTTGLSSNHGVKAGSLPAEISRKLF